MTQQRPYAQPGDPARLSPHVGGCWFCYRAPEAGDDMVFDGEFDTNVHVSCIAGTLDENPEHPEAIHMKYLLPKEENANE